MLSWRLVLAVFTLAVAISVPYDVAAEAIGQIKMVTGKAYIVRDQNQLMAQAGDLLQQEDILSTEADSTVGITFIDNSRFSLGPDSRLELKQFRFNPTTREGTFVSEIQRGTLAITSGHIAKSDPEAMKVRTPTTILGVQGTKFVVRVSE